MYGSIMFCCVPPGEGCDADAEAGVPGGIPADDEEPHVRAVPHAPATEAV